MPLTGKDRAAAEKACPDLYAGRSKKKWIAAVEEYVESRGVTVEAAIAELKVTLHDPTASVTV